MNQSIPKRIIQTAKSTTLPLIEKVSSVNITLLNPGFEYLFFDDRQVEEFIDKQFPQYRKNFDAFKIPIQRYDFFRYLAIFYFGGFYFDLDVLLAVDLTALLSFGCVFPFERLTWVDFLRDKYDMDWEVGNYAFGATPGHPFIGQLIQNCIRTQTDPIFASAMTKSLPSLLSKELDVIYTTGPGMASRTLAEYRNVERPVEVLFPPDVCDKHQWNLFGQYGVHLGEGSWRVRHSNFRRRLLNLLGRRNENRAIRLGRKIGPKRSLTFKTAIN